MDTIESATAKGNTGDALDLPRPHRSVGSQLFGDRLTPYRLSAPAPMPSVCSPAPMPSIVLYTAPSDTCAEFPWSYQRSLSKCLILQSGLLRLDKVTSCALVRLYSLADRCRDFSNSL